MIKKLKVKIFSSFMLLVLMLLIAGVMSIWELRKMNNSFSDVIDNNYQSIEDALKVIDALEREDSGILMVYLGDETRGLSVIHAGDSIIQRAMIELKKNATEKGEEDVIQNIESEYAIYSLLIDSALASRSSKDEEVYKTLHNQFIKTKTEVNFLMQLNQNSMYAKATEMHNKLYQTMMPGIVSIVLAIIFALLLNFYISRYFVTPLHKLIIAIQSYKPPLSSLNVEINSEDELKTLKMEIDHLIRRIISYCKSE